MGYTHYWRHQEIPQDRWDLITADAEKLILAATNEGTKLWHEYDEPDTLPAITSEEIFFNGADEEGHETFHLTSDGADFTFCKTAYKPYDKVVCAILAVAKQHAPDHITVSSDGDEADWREPLAWASEVLARDVPSPLGRGEV